MGLLPDISIGDAHLHRINLLSDLLSSPTPSGALMADTLRTNEPRQTDEWPDSIVRIDDYSQGNPGGMAHFYEAVASRDGLGRPVRIAVLGDSFFGEDICICALREHLQDVYGGEGVGWVFLADKQAERRATVRHTYGQAEEYIPRQEGYDWHQALPTLRYCQVEEGAWAHFGGTGYKRHLRGWNTASLFSTTQVGISEAQNDQGTALAVHTDKAGGLARHSVKQTGKGLAIRTWGRGTAYGVALESASGIIVDDLATQGMTGKEVGKVPSSLACDFASLRPYDLIVLEYGLNTADDKNKDYHYDNYLNQMRKTLSRLREAWPEASLLVMGVPDRAGNTPDGLATMPCIYKMNATLRQLAQEEMVGYYSLFDAMGGANSMVGMVQDKLANKDYTHLNYRGGDVLGKAIYESLTTGCHLYGKSTTKQKK